jgi:hypothetical protein
MAAEFAAAQTNASAKLPKDVKSEVLSLRPVKPAASLAFTDRPTPNGYRATLSIWQAIMRGYTTDDNVTWGATLCHAHRATRPLQTGNPRRTAQAEMLELIVAKGGPRLEPAAPGATLPAHGAKLASGGIAIGERPGGRTAWHYIRRLREISCSSSRLCRTAVPYTTKLASPAATTSRSRR